LGKRPRGKENVEKPFDQCYVQFELFVSVVCSAPLAFVPRVNKGYLFLFFILFIKVTVVKIKFSKEKKIPL